ESKVARDSHAVLIATESGKVASVTADQIVVTKDGHMPEGRKKLKTDIEAGIHVYELRKFMRSNAGTCVNQKPIVKRGQHVKRGQIIADGPNTDQGELALGRNVLVAFMQWNGYNFEDAIMNSEKVVKDTSLTVPSGTYGIVMDVKVSSRREVSREKLTPTETKRQLKTITEDYRKKKEGLTEQLTDSLSNILLGEKVPLDVVNAETGEIIIPANRKITKTLLRKLAMVHDHIEIDPSPIRNKIREIITSYEHKFAELELERERAMDRVESGDDIDPGIIKQVKVYIASKRKLSVGDKMAGRHGNKGVVARIVPE